jgi:hypothetical protein
MEMVTTQQDITSKEENLHEAFRAVLDRFYISHKHAHQLRVSLDLEVPPFYIC